MTASLIDGNAVARAARAKLADRTQSLARRGVAATLAVLVVGEQPASQTYVRSKIAACERAGIRALRRGFAGDVSQEVLLEAIRHLNGDAGVHGILVQLPLPPHLDVEAIAAAIAPDKDVDGFHPTQLGGLLRGAAALPPCTPQGVMALLDAAQVPIAGRHAVVVGRSNIVGKPMALMLLERDATTTLCTSKTLPLEDYTRQADILVVAAGRPKLIHASMVKPGAAVIDVGIHRDADGGLVGDVDFEGVREVAGCITPVPGGVGPMTVTMLLANTLSAAERRAHV
jgi:methylenetetrahydrofolate dehydrogenase (NADP+)/methenyltetrahydrofolate cyclohydrolase